MVNFLPVLEVIYQTPHSSFMSVEYKPTPKPQVNLSMFEGDNFVY